MTTQSVNVDLQQPPRQRWQLSRALQKSAADLLIEYQRDLAGFADYLPTLIEIGRGILPADQLDEMVGIAERSDLSVEQVMIGNLYYDALKTLWGCTAFVVDDDNGPLHARNLDWWTENGALSTSTLTTRFVGGDRGEFVTVGWPGFVGALSGIATGRFSVSLNAVASEDGVEVAVPVVSLLRQVLERAVDFDDAVATLSSTPIASDCLLTVAGTKRGEGVVIERTPTRHAVRRMEHGIVVATNDYRALSVSKTAPASTLSETSCDRFDRAVERLGTAPSTLDACLSILGDTRIQMGITVQQMAFRARSGDHRVRLPTTTTTELG